jgi:hypothetical protein
VGSSIVIVVFEVVDCTVELLAVGWMLRRHLCFQHAGVRLELVSVGIGREYALGVSVAGGLQGLGGGSYAVSMRSSLSSIPSNSAR